MTIEIIVIHSPISVQQKICGRKMFFFIKYILHNHSKTIRFFMVEM